MNNKHRPTEERFWEKVDKIPNNGCWTWNAGKFKTGYGIFAIKRVGKWINVRAHRFAYEMLVAPIPKDEEIDHLCRNRCCVNPRHLEIVSHKENCRRGENGLKFAEMQRQKTHCPRGHPYNETNTYINGKGARMCRICRNNWREIKLFNQSNSPLVH